MENWINLQDYTVLQQVLFFLDAVFWVITYILVERNVRKYRYVGIPYMAVCCNIAWEFIWSFFFQTNLGPFFEWGIRLWFLIDLYLLYRLMQYGAKQTDNPFLKAYFKPMILFFALVYGVLMYMFTKQYGDPIGATTGYFINLVMSIGFIFLFLSQPSQKALSLDIALFKMLGTGFVGVGIYLAMCPITSLFP